MTLECDGKIEHVHDGPLHNGCLHKSHVQNGFYSKLNCVNIIINAVVEMLTADAHIIFIQLCTKVMYLILIGRCFLTRTYALHMYQCEPLNF